MKGSSLLSIASLLLLSSIFSGCLDGFRDTDGDGISDNLDNCPNILNSDQIDHDGDKIGNDCDTDDDNDGMIDSSDLCQYGEVDWVTRSLSDFDSDGCKDSTEDDDDDNDGVSDENDAFPKDENESTDTDGDGTGDNADDDDDGDGVPDSDDDFPLDPTETSDFDGDGTGDNADDDDDNDGVTDDNDWFIHGNGAILLEFNKFEIWNVTGNVTTGGDYDPDFGLPDVYSYVGIYDSSWSSCGPTGGASYTYNDYLDNIHTNASSLENWDSIVWDIDEDSQRACFIVMIYDYDHSWFSDDILDFVPESNSCSCMYYEFDLVYGILSSYGEGSYVENLDNRGENSLSIMVEYQFSSIPLTFPLPGSL